MRRIGEETFDANGVKRHPALAGLSNARLHGCRSAVPSDPDPFRQESENYRGLNQLACALLSYRAFRRLTDV